MRRNSAALAGGNARKAAWISSLPVASAARRLRDWPCVVENPKVCGHGVNGDLHRPVVGGPAGMPDLDDGLVLFQSQEGPLILGSATDPNGLCDPDLLVPQIGEPADDAARTGIDLGQGGVLGDLGRD